MAFIPVETYQHHGPLRTGNSHHSSIFTNDIFSEYPFASITGAQQTNNSYNSYDNTRRPVVRNIKIQLEEDESEKENETKIQVFDSVNGIHAYKKHTIETQSSESNEISSNETPLSVSQPALSQRRISVLREKENERKNQVVDSIVDSINDAFSNNELNNETQSSESNKISSNENLTSVSQPTIGEGRKSVLLDLWNMNKISLEIRNWLVNSNFDLTPIIGNYQKGVSCGYIAAQAACIFRKKFTKEIDDEPIRQLILSKCLDPELINKVNDILKIDNTEAVSLDMVQIYEVILSLMGGSDDLSWLTVTTWDAFLEGMREGHQSQEFSVWIINTADTESSLQEDYDDRGDHWFTVVIWP